MWSKLSRHDRGYGTTWDKLRLVVLARDRYLCQTCRRGGRAHEGTQVDHIKPKADGGSDALDNLEAICKAHHEEKTLRESGRMKKTAVGEDGWPVLATGGIE